MEQAKELVKIKNTLKWQTSIDQKDSIDWRKSAKYMVAALAVMALFSMFFASSSPLEQSPDASVRAEVKKPAVPRDSIALPAAEGLAGLPKPGEQLLMQLQQYYADNQTWLAQDDTGRYLLVALEEPEVYIETEFIGVEVDEARYTDSGQLVVFAR